MKKVKINKKFILGILVLTIIASASWWWLGKNNNSAAQTGDVKSLKDSLIDEIQIKKSYTLAGIDPQNVKSKKGSIQMTVTKARKLEQVQVKGEPLDAPSGKVFLSLDLELKNDGSEGLGFFSRDYFRLIVDGNPFAPQFYNNGVGIVAVSTKGDRIAFLVDEKLKEFKIQVGELNQPETQEVIELKFKK